MTTEEKVETLKVIKRNGKKVDFDGTKIALAIKKGFDSIKDPETDESGSGPRRQTVECGHENGDRRRSRPECDRSGT